MFPKANTGDKTEVLLPSESYITKVSSILSTTDRGWVFMLNESSIYGTVKLLLKMVIHTYSHGWFCCSCKRNSSWVIVSDSRSLNNYMMWVLALHYLPYLSQEFRDTVSYFTKEMTGELLHSLQAWYLSRGSSVSIVCDHRLDDQGLIPFTSSPCIQPGSGPPSPLSSGCKGSFLGGKAAQTWK
jgi:hypothetical protein